MHRIEVLVVNLLDQDDDELPKLIQALSTKSHFSFTVVSDWDKATALLRASAGGVVFPLIDAAHLAALACVKKLRNGVAAVHVVPIIRGPISNRTQHLPLTLIDDFMLWPASGEEIIARLNRFLPHESPSPLDEIKRTLLVKFGLKKLVGQDPKFCAALAKVQQIAVCDAPVLLQGETGTGKELFARAIHYLSSRSGKPFIAINCAAIPTELFENELFGHVKGAFTGAVGFKEGVIQAAEQGTLFLDEIDSLSSNVQAKLLRFLEEKEYKPLGRNSIVKADVRILASARNNLASCVQGGAFRDDLFYRLSVIALNLPPLRERRNDIALLAEHFLRKYSTELCKRVSGLSEEVVDALTSHNWPGNVRELENVIYHAVAVSQSPTIDLGDLNLPPTIHKQSSLLALSFAAAKNEAIASFEQEYVTSRLREHGGNITRAARAAGKDRRAFRALVRKYKIDPHNLAR